MLPGQRQNIQGVVHVGIGHDDDPVIRFPDGEDDVGADDIIVHDHHQAA